MFARQTSSRFSRFALMAAAVLALMAGSAEARVYSLNDVDAENTVEDLHEFRYLAANHNHTDSAADVAAVAGVTIAAAAVIA